jgi:hypothetical protein
MVLWVVVVLSCVYKVVGLLSLCGDGIGWDGRDIEVRFCMRWRGDRSGGMMEKGR